jgi:polysaccharide biosynthesis protein PslH
MKILLALPGPLFPPDTGGKVRSLNIFSRLTGRAEIHALSFADPQRDLAGIADMKAMFASYTPVFRREATKYSLRFYGEVLASQCGSLPYFLAKRDVSAFRATAGELASRGRFDLLFCDFLHTAAPLLDFAFKPRVVFEHNVEFLLRKRKWETESRPLRKWIFHNEWKKTRTIEGEVCRSFDCVISVSEEDRRTIEQEFRAKCVAVLPTGVDTRFFCPGEDQTIRGRLVFVGSMDWDPNEDGVIWFVREIYPHIRRWAPHASFSIVGRSPSSRLRAIVAGDPTIEITGAVPDVRPHQARAEVVVVPLRVGGGTRIKIPEAMAMGKAVVSTPVGAEGLPFRDGREIRIAEKPEAFAQAVVQLLRETSLRTSLSQAARRAVVTRHSWENVVGRLEETLAGVSSDGRVAA